MCINCGLVYHIFCMLGPVRNMSTNQIQVDVRVCARTSEEHVYQPRLGSYFYDHKVWRF